MKKVFVSGNFNIIHPGHLRLLRFAKESGDYLIVGVNSDRLIGEKAHIPEGMRLEGLISNTWVDEAFILDEELEHVIRRIRPDIVVKGKEHEKLPNPELKFVNEYGGRLVFSSGESFFSSLDLLRKENAINSSKKFLNPIEFLERHSIKKNILVDIVQKFKQKRVCVIGDLIVDEYITCEPLGMSMEDPTIVVTPVESVRYIGGAGIVAAHARGLGASVDFLSVVGADDSADFSRDIFDHYEVKYHLFCDEGRPTTLKKRFRSNGKTLLRVSELRQSAISQELQDRMLDVFSKIVTNLDLLIFSDFNYGCLPQGLVDRLVNIAIKNNVFMVADSQSSSQLGDISRFQGMNLLMPTEREARLSTKLREEGLITLVEQLKELSSADNIILKLGKEGILVHTKQNRFVDWYTDRVSALNIQPVDVAGAGDSMMIVAGLALQSGASIWESALLGSIAAAVQVDRVGNIPIKSSEIIECLA